MLSEAEVNISDISHRLGVIWEIPSQLRALNMLIQDGVVDNLRQHNDERNLMI